MKVTDDIDYVKGYVHDPINREYGVHELGKVMAQTNSPSQLKFISETPTAVSKRLSALVELIVHVPIVSAPAPPVIEDSTGCVVNRSLTDNSVALFFRINDSILRST